MKKIDINNLFDYYNLAEGVKSNYLDKWYYCPLKSKKIRNNNTYIRDQFVTFKNIPTPTKSPLYGISYNPVILCIRVEKVKDVITHCVLDYYIHSWDDNDYKIHWKFNTYEEAVEKRKMIMNYLNDSSIIDEDEAEKYFLENKGILWYL